MVRNITLRLQTCLPGVVFVLYSAQSIAQQVPQSLFPKSGEIAGWSIKTPLVNYQANQLFNYMDGAAEIPKSYGFRALGSAKYQKAGVTLEVAVFDMGTAADAFGFYSARVFLEHSPRSKERIVQLDHPAHIYSTVGVLTFWKDHYTVILQPDDGKPDDDSLLAFARFVSSHIGAKGVEPARLRALPEANMVANSKRYIRGKAAFDATVMFTAKDVFGMSAGPDAAAAEYNLNGNRITLAIIKYQSSEAASRAESKLRQTMASGKTAPAISAVPGAFVGLSTGRVKGVGAITSAAYLLLVVEAKDAKTVDAGLRELVKAMRAKQFSRNQPEPSGLRRRLGKTGDRLRGRN